MLAYNNQINNYDEMRRSYPNEFDDLHNFILQQQLVQNTGLQNVNYDMSHTHDQVGETPGPIFWGNSSSLSTNSYSSQGTPILMDDGGGGHAYEGYSLETFEPSCKKTIGQSSNSRKDEAPTKCLVCGVATNNFHYDVSSCNGCKTFFRRCVVLSKFYKCRLNKQCDIRHDMEGNPCKGCRLAQCMVIGMNPIAIQFPKHVDVELVLQKFEDFKQMMLPQYMTLSVKSPEESLVQELNDLLYIEFKFKKLRESTYMPEYIPDIKIRDILKEPKVELSAADKFQKPKEWPMSLDQWRSKMVKKINVIIHHKLTGEPMPPDMKQGPHKFWITIDHLLVIDAAKTLPFFRLLSIDDQELLLKHITLVNTTLMEGFYSYSKNYETVVMPDGSIPFKFQKIKKEVIEEKKKNGDLDIKWDFKTGIIYADNIMQTDLSETDEERATRIRNFFDSREFKVAGEGFDELYSRILDPIKRVDLTEKEYVLLKTLIYCYNALPDLSPYAREILQREANKYSQFLLKHLQLEYGEFKGATKYAELISLISVFFNMAEKHRQIYLLHKIARETGLIGCGKKNDGQKPKFQPQFPAITLEIMHAI